MITDEAVLARRYFQEAVALHPHDARYLGFLGSTQLAEGMPDVRLDPDHWASIFLKVWRNWFEAKLS